MEMKFEKQSFKKMAKSMLKVDFKRMFTMPLFYIMVGVCFVMPILILVMTTMMPSTTIDPVTGAEKAVETFTNVWQAIGSASGSEMSMGLTSMCNINLVYFLIAIAVCIFVSEDFRSGYAKNLFTVRSKKSDYVLSKTLVGFVVGLFMIVAYFVGAMLGGAIAGLSFDLAQTNVFGIVMCMLSKIFIAAIYVSISLLLSVVGKSRLWLSILGTLGAGALMFTMIPMMTPLNATVVHMIMCLAGGAIFGVGIGAVSNLILKKTSLV